MACTLFRSFRSFPDSIIIDNWLYVMPEDLDRELVTQERISEQECASSLVLIHPSFLLSTFSRFIRLRFLKLFEALDKAFQQRRYRSTRSLPTFNEITHIRPCQTLLKGTSVGRNDGQLTERCFSESNEVIDKVISFDSSVFPSSSDMFSARLYSLVLAIHRLGFSLGFSITQKLGLQG